MENQTSNRVLMVRPATFFYNEETAKNNSFQVEPSTSCQKRDIHDKAIAEFNGVVNLLRGAGVIVEVIHEEPDPTTTDSVFPNNWISFHCERSEATIGQPEGDPPLEDNTAVLYPMWSGNRQLERKKLRNEVMQILPVGTTLLDLSPLEKKGRYLEGTGSLVLDRSNRIAYACLSPRTTREVVELFCKRLGYNSMVFNGLDSKGKPCYHTNVMMSVADKYCIICLDAIVDLGERVEVEVMIKNSGKVLIPLSLEQMDQFAGNCLQLRGSQSTFLAMSSRAYSSLKEDQVAVIGQFDKILHADIETIENFGGGSVRCMIAELGEVEVDPQPS